MQNNTDYLPNFNKQLHKHIYIADSCIHGKGLFAGSFIPEGTIIGWLQGSASSVDGAYVLWLSDTRGIEVHGDLKYINHADHPNACYYDDLSVVALRDIQADEEITHNYAIIE
ncbi:MAG: hypothetical protein ACI9LO_000183 [Planctomycetota bacterium]